MSDAIEFHEGFQIIEGDTAQELVEFINMAMANGRGNVTFIGFSIAPRPATGLDPEGIPTYRYAMGLAFAPVISGLVMAGTMAQVRIKPS